MLEEWGLVQVTLLLTRALSPPPFIEFIGVTARALLTDTLRFSPHRDGLWCELPLVLLMARLPGDWYLENGNKHLHSLLTFTNICLVKV